MFIISVLYSTTENQFSLMVILWQFTAAVVEMSRMCCIAESSSYASSITTAWRWSDVTTSHAWTHDATDGSGTSCFIFCVSSTAPLGDFTFWIILSLSLFAQSKD